jgi:hypothetical protein
MLVDSKISGPATSPPDQTTLISMRPVLCAADGRTVTSTSSPSRRARPKSRSNENPTRAHRRAMTRQAVQAAGFCAAFARLSLRSQIKGPNSQGEFGSQQLLVRVFESEIGEHIAAAGSNLVLHCLAPSGPADCPR